MSHFHHHLIYCTDNHAVADEIADDLRASGHSFSLHGISDEPDSLALSTLDLTPTNGKVVLLVTDNFLKNANCLHGAQPVVRKWAENRLLVPVVADGTTIDEHGNVVPVETSFDRVSQIILYMNHWQDKYLEYRKLKRTDGDSDELDEQIAVTKEISADVGELLRFLRSLDHFTMDEFQEKGYARFRLGTGEKVALSNDEDEDLEPSDAERKLVQIIEGSSDDLIAENSELDARFEGIEDELDDAEESVPEEILAEIPGMSLLENEETAPPADPADDSNLDAEAASLLDELLMHQDEDEVAADSPEQPEEAPNVGSITTEPQGNHDEDNDELESILDEVLEEEGFGDDDTDFKFLSEDSDEETDFDLDSIFEDDENLLSDDDEMEEVGENELVIDLLEDDDDEILVAIPNGKKASPEEVLEHAIDLFTDNRQEEGLAHLNSTLEANPANTTLRYYYAYSLARYSNDMEGAKHHLEILLKQDNRHPEAWYLLGELAENQEDYEGARKCFEKAININPDYPDIYYRLGLLTVQHFPGEEKQAAKWFRKAIDEDNLNADAEYALANVLNKRLGEPKKAAKHFQRALKIQPEHPYANYDLALLHYQQGERELAANFYQKATAVNPTLKTEQNDAAFLTEEPSGALSDRSESSNGNLEKHGTKSAATPPSGDVDVVTEEEQAPAEPIAATAPELKKSGNGAIVLISGGTAGIGRATADIFAKNGYRVIITGRRAERLEEIKNSLSESYDTDVQTLAFDVRDPEAMQAAIDNLPEAWREVDILINNAGLSQGLSAIHEGDLAHWDTMIDTNVKGLLYLTRAVAPHMVARRRGTIINVCSGAAKEVYPGGNVYCATKSAVEALTKGMRLDLYQHNIRVGQVSPGHVEETEFARVRFDGDVERAAKTYDNFQPLRASDVAEAIFFMASRPPHVNIHDIFLNGTQQASSNFIDRSGRGE